MLQGWRTVIVGLCVAIGPAAFDYLLHVDWTKYVGAQYVPLVSGALMIGMRFLTKTPVGTKS